MRTGRFSLIGAAQVRLLAVVALVAVGLWSSPAAAAVPNAISVEGALLSGGAPGGVVDGAYTLTFSLYDSEAAQQALWKEIHLAVKVTGGRFSAQLGSVDPVNNAFPVGALLTQPEVWLGVAVGADPEMPRERFGAVPYALVAAAGTFNYAGSNSQGGPALSALFADQANTALVAQGLQCSGCVTVDKLNIDDNLDLGQAAIKAKEFIGDGSKLTDLPVPSGTCPEGEVVSGIQPDGTLSCTSNALPDDALGAVSNGLLTNEFVDKIASSAAPVGIADNNPIGVSDTITVPDLGIAKALKIEVDIINSDMSTVEVTLFDANNTPYTLWQNNGPGTELKATFPAPTPTLSGDLTQWYGQNPKGNWTLKVVDLGFKDNGVDGEIVNWSVNIETISNQKIQLKGDLIVEGNVTINGGQDLGGLVPTGAVMPFNLAACPEGWVAADGQNNTVDLRGRFAIGAGNLPQGGSVALGAAGGSHRYRIGGSASNVENICCGNNKFISFSFEWQGEGSQSTGNGWTGYKDHLPPYRGVLYCQKQ